MMRTIFPEKGRCHGKREKHDANGVTVTAITTRLTDARYEEEEEEYMEYSMIEYTIEYSIRVLRKYLHR